MTQRAQIGTRTRPATSCERVLCPGPRDWRRRKRLRAMPAAVRPSALTGSSSCRAGNVAGNSLDRRDFLWTTGRVVLGVPGPRAIVPPACRTALPLPPSPRLKAWLSPPQTHTVSHHASPTGNGLSFAQPGFTRTVDGTPTNGVCWRLGETV